MVTPAIRLNPGEQIMDDEMPSAFWTAPLYAVTLGLWVIWRNRHHFLVTNQRVIIMMGILTKSERSIPLARIQDVSLLRSIFFGGYVRISSAGGTLGIERLGPLSRERARQFADAIAQVVPALGDGVSDGAVPTLNGVPLIGEELGRLAALRDAGVLTEREFAAQKARLLG